MPSTPFPLFEAARRSVSRRHTLHSASIAASWNRPSIPTVATSLCSALRASAFARASAAISRALTISGSMPSSSSSAPRVVLVTRPVAPGSSPLGLAVALSGVETGSSSVLPSSPGDGGGEGGGSAAASASNRATRSAAARMWPACISSVNLACISGGIGFDWPPHRELSPPPPPPLSAGGNLGSSSPFAFRASTPTTFAGPADDASAPVSARERAPPLFGAGKMPPPSIQTACSFSASLIRGGVASFSQFTGTPSLVRCSTSRVDPSPLLASSCVCASVYARPGAR